MVDHGSQYSTYSAIVADSLYNKCSQHPGYVHIGSMPRLQIPVLPIRYPLSRMSDIAITASQG
jgi:hypothetical protein